MSQKECMSTDTRGHFIHILKAPRRRPVDTSGRRRAGDSKSTCNFAVDRALRPPAKTIR